jgi:GNAT superfamily N-acetyltransferase
VGPFELFLREPPSWPYYARPRLGTTTVTAAEVEAVRARQRELGVPEALEWVHDITPSLLPAVEETGLSVVRAPLMVLNPDKLPAFSALANASSLAGVDIAILDPDSPEFERLYTQSAAVAQIAFGAAGTATGPAGPTERDAAAASQKPGRAAFVARGLRTGRTVEAVAATPIEGIVARGATQRGAGAVEIVGVATLPSARRRGLGAAISARLARYALDAGAELVFLAAQNEDVARIYASIGFERVGTSCIAET